MNELYDYLQTLIGTKNCPIISIHPVFGTTENYFELTMKNGENIRVSESKICITKDWRYARPMVGLDEMGLPIFINSWDDKVKRSLNNE
jgi:hypothetical protein